MSRKSIAEIRKAEIIEAFLKVASKKGLAKASVREVANEAGCSHGMVRHYFGDKETMMREALDFMIAWYTGDFQKGMPRNASARERLRHLISWWVDLGKFDIEWNRTIMELRVIARFNQAVSDKVGRYYRLAMNTIADIIRDGIKAKEFRKVDPVHTANLICSTLDGILGFESVDPEGMEVRLKGEQAAELFENYLRRDE